MENKKLIKATIKKIDKAKFNKLAAKVRKILEEESKSVQKESNDHTIGSSRATWTP